MTDTFEDHCWKNVVSPEVLEVYSCYQRETFVGPNPVLAHLQKVAKSAVRKAG